MLKKRTVTDGEPGVVRGADPSDTLAGHFPTLWEFLAAEVWPETSERREPGAVVLFLDSGVPKALVKDKDAGQVCFVTSDTFWGLLGAVERILEEGGGDWREDKFAGAGKRKR